MTPLGYRCRRPGAAFQHDHVDATLDQMSRCGETLGTCSDDDDRMLGHHFSSDR
jgi:hypothetical protein